MHKSNPKLFADWRSEQLQPLISPVSERSIFHELAITEPTKIPNAIAFNVIPCGSEEVSEAREAANIPWKGVPGMIWCDTYGWKTSDYLIAKGAMDSLLMMCVSFMSTDLHDSNVPDRGHVLWSIDFYSVSRCKCLFTGKLMRVPPELSTILDVENWPAAGKSRRQLAQDLGHEDIVELIDFIMFHREASSLLFYVDDKYRDSFATAKETAKTFSRLVEAGLANSTWHA